DVGQVLADDRRAVDEAAVALGDEDAEQRVLDPRVDDAHVGRVVDADAGILGGVRVAASPDGQAAHLHAGSGDAEHGALTVAVAQGAGVPHEVDRAREEDVLVLNARGRHDRVTVAGGGDRGGDGGVSLAHDQVRAPGGCRPECDEGEGAGGQRLPTTPGE